MKLTQIRSWFIGLLATAFMLPVGAVDYTMEYDANGNVLNRSNQQHQHEFNYDALDRLIQDTTDSPQIDFDYDENGNRTMHSKASDSTAYSYTPDTNRLSAIDGASYQYDEIGNIVSDPKGWTYSYDDTGRLVEIKDETDNVLATYTYNFKGQRTKKTTPQGTTIYHYDLGGNLISETHTDGTPKSDYIWDGILPVAKVHISAPGNEQVVYLHTDHLATPRLATLEDGTVIWENEGQAFGELWQNGNGTAPTFISLRFPGQYFDAESGLHYNWNRYYDPKTGRYITSDPIGLNGGINTFLYANANPQVFIDPFGLAGRTFEDFLPPGTLGGGCGVVPTCLPKGTTCDSFVRAVGTCGLPLCIPGHAQCRNSWMEFMIDCWSGAIPRCGDDNEDDNEKDEPLSCNGNLNRNRT